jgi:hypothetical protein
MLPPSSRWKRMGIRIYQHTVLLSGNRTVKLVTPSCCSLDNQQNYKHFGGLHNDYRKRLTTGQENAWWQNCYTRALDEEQKEEDFRKVGYLHRQPPWEPQISLHNTRPPVRNKQTHTHTHTYTHTHARSLLARTTMESSGDVKTLFQSSTLQERNLKVAPQYKPTALSLPTWKNQITQDRKYWTQ